jgi:hypothetical protein
MHGILLTTETITWVKVDHAKLDIVGVILGSLGLAGALASLALLLGALLGLSLVLRRRHEGAWADEHAALRLSDSRA